MLDKISPDAIVIAKQCMRAAVEGPFFPDWEFETLFGVERETVKTVHEAWPKQTIGDDDFRCAVVGSVGHILGYPHAQDDIWDAYISVSPDRVREILDELTAVGL